MVVQYYICRYITDVVRRYFINVGVIIVDNVGHIHMLFDDGNNIVSSDIPLCMVEDLVLPALERFKQWIIVHDGQDIETIYNRWLDRRGSEYDRIQLYGPLATFLNTGDVSIDLKELFGIFVRRQPSPCDDCRLLDPDRGCWRYLDMIHQNTHRKTIEEKQEN